ncbi:KRRI-Interacting protein 1, partial [Rhizophlyctis rosea]
MGRNLLDDDLGDDTFLQINENFARKYEEKKKYEELTKLKKQYGDEDDEPQDSESEEEEDEFGELVTPEVDGQIMKTIVSIRSRKPEVYDPKVNFFSEDLLEKAGKQWQEKQQAIKASGKPIRLADYHRNKLLEGANDEDEDEQDSRPLTHAEEQAKLKDDLKSAFHSFADGGDEDDDFLELRTKTDDESKKEEEEYRNFLLENMAQEGGQGIKDWKNFQEVKDDPDEAFLMDYILNRGWVEKGAFKTPTYDEVVGEVNEDEDEEVVEAAEEFERKHNFRFEEDGATQVITHARTIDGTLRRKDDKRKRQRESRAERQALEKLKKSEELKRLKNLKKEEIREKLKQIQQIAGGDSVGFDEVDLEKDFDPNEYDRKMEETFGEGYYEAEDANMKPDFGDDDIDISDL